MTVTLRDVLTARIVYPKFSERLACEPEAPGVVRLREFSDFLPLAPGDLLAVNDEGVVTDVLDLAPGFLVEAHFHLDTDRDVLLATVGEWDRATRVQPETLTAFVLSASEEWIEEVVKSDPTVEFIQIRRAPGEPVIFDPAASLGW